MRRFYESAEICEVEGGFGITLDGKPVKTPGKALLMVPSRGLALAIAAEWQAQEEEIDTETMPLTKLANTAQDRVGARFDEVASEVCRFAGTDLLCYRADDPVELIKRQAEVWDPYLLWAKETLGAELAVTDGIMPIEQSDVALDAISRVVRGLSPYELAALHEFTNGFGSIVLALAYMQGVADLETIWQASILDQVFQEEAWGEDYEAAEKKEKLQADLVVAAAFLSRLRDKSTGQ